VKALALLCPAILITAMSAVASANPGTVGYSGKPYASGSGTCAQSGCHTATGNKPSINLTVPTTMTAGSSQEFTVTVSGGLGSTSFDAALPDGVQVTAGNNTEVPFPQNAEVVPKVAPTGGNNNTYRFTVKAPAYNGTMKFYVAAMSTNNNGSRGDDGVATATRDITITGGTTGSADAGPGGTRPEDGVTGTRDAGAAGGDGGSTGNGGSTNSDQGDGYEDDSPKKKSDGGCSVGNGAGAAATGGLWLVMGACMAYIRRRRREA
jgi:hypothetical protein